MTSSEDINDYYILKNQDYWRVSDINAEYVKHFITVQRVKGITTSSVATYTESLCRFLRVLNKDALKADTDDILNTFLTLKGELSPPSINRIILVVKMFYKEYYSDEEIKSLVPIQRNKCVNEKETTDYITLEDVIKLRNYAESQGDLRGVALIMMLAGTGARISELLDANIGDVEIKQYNGILSVNGKTGKRKIPFVIGLPELINWLNAHPYRNDKDQPIFITYNTRGNKVKRMSVSRVETYILYMKRAVGIPDKIKCSPHAFRHLLATTMAKKLSLREMNRLFGWSDGSNTVLTYLHTSDKDLEDSILNVNGVSKTEEEKPTEMYIQCPSCNAILPPGAIQCPKCRMILDPVLAVELNNITDDSKQRKLLKEYLDTD